MSKFICIPIVLFMSVVAIDAKADTLTSFNFLVNIEGQSYSFNENLTNTVQVVMPPGPWKCLRRPVVLSNHKYAGGFICSFDNYKTTTEIWAFCGVDNSDHDSGRATMSIGNKSVSVFSSCKTNVSNIDSKLDKVF